MYVLLTYVSCEGVDIGIKELLGEIFMIDIVRRDSDSQYFLRCY